MSFSLPVMRQVAALVHRAQVTGVQPALRVDGRRRGVGQLEVGVHHLVAARADLARRPDRQRPPVAGSTILTSAWGSGRPIVRAWSSGESVVAVW